LLLLMPPPHPLRYSTLSIRECHSILSDCSRLLTDRLSDIFAGSCELEPVGV
jgi:hypothetical protein